MIVITHIFKEFPSSFSSLVFLWYGLPMKYLGWVTVVLTYVLMVWGNLVSATGSGLACPDWPLCNGTVFPTLSFPVILEWGHRLLALTTSIFIVITVVKGFQSAKRSGNLAALKYGKFILCLLIAQILLGGLTVFLGLSIFVSTVHLIIASLVWSGLIALAYSFSTVETTVDENPAKCSELHKLLVFGAVFLLVQIILGAVVRHSHAGLSCPTFPHCREGSFFPSQFLFEEWISFTHRWWGILTVGFFGYFAYYCAKNSLVLSRVSRRMFALSVAQVFLGIGTVASGLSVHSRAIHAAVGYLLWGKMSYAIIVAASNGAKNWSFWSFKKCSTKLNPRPI